MTHPGDNSQLLTTADEIREYEFERGFSSRDEEVRGLVAAAFSETARANAIQAEFDAYKAAHPDTPDDPDPEPVTGKLIGMSSPENLWPTRLAQVGPEGVTARRIFVQSLSNGQEKADVITAAHAAGMLPVVSYKAYGSWTPAWAEKAAAFLDSFGKTTAVVFNHEPHGDMSPAQFVDLQRKLTPIFQRGRLKVGPLLNGWLLDRRRADFESYMTDDLLEAWDFMGIDSYQSGTEDSPGPIFSGHRIAPLLEVLDDRGHPDMPLVVGEYNGWTTEAVRFSGEVFLSTPSLWAALVFNSETGGKGKVLEGDRLEAFQGTKSDDRAAR